LTNNPNIKINYREESIPKRTPFLIACENGFVDIVKLLLNDERIDVNQTDAYTPFWIACASRQIEIVKLLLNDKRVNVNQAQIRDRRSPFFYICQSRDYELMKLLLNSQRIDVNKSESQYGQTPFYRACAHGYTEVVKILLKDERVDLHKGDIYDRGPFFASCQYGHIKIVEHILASGREINLGAKNKSGKSAIDAVRRRQKHKKGFYEPIQTYEKRKIDAGLIIELVESFQKDPNETRMKLRKRLELDGKLLFYFSFFNS